MIEEYAEVFPELPPVKTFFDGKTHWLSDGFHRLEAAKKIGATLISVEVHQGNQRDAIMDAVAANETHGLRRSNDDRRRAVRLLLDDEEWRGWANTEIARQCRVSEYFVRNVKKDIGFDEGEQDEGRPRKTTRKGKQVTVQTKRIGRGREKPPDEKKPLADEQLQAPVAETIEELTAVATSIQSKLDGDEIGAAEALPHMQEAVSPTLEVGTQPDALAKPSLLDVWDSVDEEARRWFVEQRYDAIVRIVQQIERGRTEYEPQEATAVDAHDATTQSPTKTTQSDLIINILSSVSRPISREELLEHEGVNRRQLGRNLTRLVKGGQIVETDGDKYTLASQ